MTIQKADKKQNNNSVLLFILTLIILLFASISLGLVALYFSAGSDKTDLFFFYLKNPLLVFLNTLPFVIIAYLFYAITNRAWIAFTIDAVLCITYSFAEYFKLQARSEPLIAADWQNISAGLEMGTNGGYIKITLRIILAVAAVIIGILILFFFFKGRFPRLLPRILTIVVLIAISAISYKALYLSQNIYDKFPIYDNRNEWLEVNRYISRGGIYPFINSIPDAIPNKPDNYSKKEVLKTLSEYKNDDISDSKKVNVISIMLEAYSDLSKLTDKITGEDPYRFYHQLQSESYTGKVFDNIFAGGTVDTERCAITGFSELSTFRQKSWSYARYFSEQGYTVVGGHAGLEHFYNRLNINANLGFPEYYFLENHYNEVSETILSDDLFLPKLAEDCLNEINKGNKLFSYNVTYQNHGPYDPYTLYTKTEYVPHDALNDYDYTVVNNYLEGIHATDCELEKFFDQFKDLKEPVVIMLFGDHKPWLGDQSCTYSALGISLLDSTIDSTLNMYTTEYVIWANQSAKDQLKKSFTGKGPTISPCFLMNQLFDQCGWKGPNYMKFTNNVMNLSPIVSTISWYGSEDNLTYFDSLSNPAKNAILKMEQIQYYLDYDCKGNLSN